MGKQFTYTDDHDNKVIGTEATALSITVGDVQWGEVYLSEKNHKALLDLISNFIPDVGPGEVKASKPTATTSTGRRKNSGNSPSALLLGWIKDQGKTTNDVKAWAKKKGITVPDRGRLSVDTMSQYVDDNGGDSKALLAA